MTIKEDAVAAKRAAEAAISALSGPTGGAPWTGSPLFEDQRGVALHALRRIQSVAYEVIEGGV